MSIKPISFVLSLSLGLSLQAAAPKIPKSPKVQVKKEAELTKCQDAAKSVTKTSKPEEIKAAAQCQFWVGEQGYAKFLAIKLPKAYDKDKLATWMNDAKKQQEDATKLYQKVLDYDDAEQQVAALARVGLLSYQYAASLNSAPLPATVEVDMNGDGAVEIVKLEGELKTQVQTTVKAELDKITAPILSDAKTAFTKCVETAKTAKIENEWSKLCGGYLLVLDPPAAEVTPSTTKKETPSGGLPVVEKKAGGVVKEK